MRTTTTAAAVLLTAAATLASANAPTDAWRFQAETVQWTDMSSAQVLVDLVQRAADTTEHHVLVRFESPVNSADRAALNRAGLLVLSPLGGASYMARIDTDQLHPGAVPRRLRRPPAPPLRACGPARLHRLPPGDLRHSPPFAATRRHQLRPPSSLSSPAAPPFLT